MARVKYYRNNVCAHASQASTDDTTFNSCWQDISNALIGLGAEASVISNLKTENMDPEFENHYQELLREWKKNDDSTKEKLDEIEGMLIILQYQNLLREWKEDDESMHQGKN